MCVLIKEMEAVINQMGCVDCKCKTEALGEIVDIIKRIL